MSPRITGLASRVAKALEQLPQRQREIFLSIVRKDLTYAELAERYGVTTIEIAQDMAQALVTLAEAADQPQPNWRRRLRRWIARKVT